MEIFKDIKGYEGLYQVSDLGNIKSLDRTVVYSNGGKHYHKGKALKPCSDDGGYLFVCLNKQDRGRARRIHQLVCEAFLGYIPNGHGSAVNHINFNRQDNRLINLEVVTQRENTNQKHIKSSSEYVGVSWSKKANKWVSNIWINRKQKNLGTFKNEYDAHLAYQSALKNL